MTGIIKSASLLALLAASVACAPMAMAAGQDHAAGTASTSASSNAGDSQHGGKNVSQQDETFVRHAAPAGMSEVKEGELALKVSPNLAVQEFGRWMVTDHTELDRFLKSDAQQAGITVPTSLTQKQQQQYQTLEGLKGQNFDRHYINDQVQAHEKAVRLFEQEAKSGQNPDIRSFAKQADWVLQQHLAEAKQLQKALPSMTAQK